ncbi:MAG: hypothetical protein RIB58_09580 [Phycisphaerales bacterium]
MKSAVASIQELMAHPAPGLVFGPHERAKLPRRAHPTRHTLSSPIGERERGELDRLIAGAPELADLAELYAWSNGVDLFALPGVGGEEQAWALSLLPVRLWAGATALWMPGGECESFMEECELYHNGTWRVFATFPSEDMNLVQFFSGEYEGRALAGRIFCVGLDGYLGFEEEVAPNLSALMDEVRRDPAAFFDRLGFGWEIGLYGDPIEAYVADVRDHPDAMPGPSAEVPG